MLVAEVRDPFVRGTRGSAIAASFRGALGGDQIHCRNAAVKKQAGGCAGLRAPRCRAGLLDSGASCSASPSLGCSRRGG
jgi:hypothetical protein